MLVLVCAQSRSGVGALAAGHPGCAHAPLLNAMLWLAIGPTEATGRAKLGFGRFTARYPMFHAADHKVIMTDYGEVSGGGASWW